MANYQELLSKAISALPENNGAARREVYERARKALVAQLRGITPPLPAREITQHRLELEDCIRQVEQQATENILGGFRQLDDEPSPSPAPQVRPRGADGESEMVPEPMAEAAPAPEPVAEPEPAPEPEPVAAPEPEPVAETQPEVPVKSAEAKPAAAPAMAESVSAEPEAQKQPAQAEAPAYDAQAEAIDDIIARADADRQKSGSPAKPKASGGPGVPRAVAEAQMADVAVEEAPAIIAHPHHFDSESETLVEDEANAVPPEPPVKAGPVEPASPPVPATDPRIKKPSAAELIRSAQAGVDAENTNQVSSAAVDAAMSQVREVELDDAVSVEMDDEEREAQSVVDRAIQILDREARGEHDEDQSDDDEPMVEHDDDLPLTADRGAQSGRGRMAMAADDDMLSSDDEESGGNALTIFLVIAVVLLLLVGGGTFWAWREGYIPLDDIFGGNGQTVATADAGDTNTTLVEDQTGPGNTATNADAVQPADQAAAVTDETPATEERLVADQTPAVTDQPSGGEERLVGDEERTVDPAIDSTQTADDATSAGAQSLLLEASSTGQTGAVPYSGTVSWERSVDELGEPTLIGKATIPARNLSVQVLIRRNADPTLPASHLFEVEFKTSDTFVGGSIASFGGILFKNEELVPGKALVGAPARIFENMFLFALSSSEQDVKNNVPLMRDDKWMDLALIYGTGRQAIITLEKDDAAQQLFDDVFAAWDAAAQQQAGN
ncbi:MAG: hypothetical protein KDJ19_05555 [Hyphomicrobiaceae bacterium]|nr:hypothetical protein [Hyphomicrobiaceae bacterium]MCC0024199.1 hypothetical protein [Hyphomicrobiaceae bacterium]